ncbi:carboxymethylenebutenolidase homolog isoform X1 [Bufo gargarizans]|uniref:carboxymethylenebutenolidase homolog isoform X1 n=2 Tax=Bufo gargarizans TaxID=30331 RepID=UPI001CF46BFD|nr:carboxymethylenebutenolidase homolog isoform X1 [Bufo gargarizans]
MRRSREQVPGIRFAMANEARPCPCELGDQFDHKNLGNEIQIEHIKAYISKPKTSTDKAIIVVQDVYGWELSNTRYFADLLASQGYIAVLPDFFVGQKPWNSTYDHADFFKWLETRPADKAYREADAVLRYLKEQCQAKSIGVIGFCWGGIVTHYLMLKYPELKAGVAFYGLVREECDKYNLLNPTLFIFGENDPLIPLEQVRSLDEKLKEHSKVDYKVKVYPKQNHGFAHRKKEEINPDDKPYILEARKDMLDWLKKYVN